MTALWEVTEESVRASERKYAFEDGIRATNEKNARAMKKEGFEPETIARITGLSVDEIIKVK
jgi:predicted transposase/invertase (TIGR01784 family)